MRIRGSSRESNFLTTGALKEFFQSCDFRGLSPATIKIYQETLKLFRPYPLTPEGVRSFFEDLKAKGNSPVSLSLYFRTLKSFFRFCKKHGIIPLDPTENLPAPQIKNREFEVLETEEIQKILQAISKGKNTLRDKLIFLLMLDTAMRPGELCNLTREDISFRNGYIKLRGKMGERIVPVSPEVLKALENYLKGKPRGFVFTTREGKPFDKDGLVHLFSRWRKRSGVKKLFPYILRHTSATFYLRNGADLETVRRLLGHTSFAITQRYLGLKVGDLAQAQILHSPIKLIKKGRP